MKIILVSSHSITKREENDEIEDFNFESGIPHYPHAHYTNDGEIDFMPRIIGGEPSWHGEFPGKVSLQTRRGSHFCGGTIIDLRHVLSAAHCITSPFGVVMNPNELRIIGDDISIQRWGSDKRQIRFVTHIFAHPSYNTWTFDADIAVIRLSVPFIQTSTFRPIPRSFSTPFDNQECQLAGWGTIHEDNTRPHPILMRVEIEIINLEVCNGTDSFRGSIPIGFFCAGVMAGGRDACQGDSGGALICNSQIAGIVSFGFGCGRRNFPGAYVDVSQFNHWIQECVVSDLAHDDIPRPSVSPNE
ncbi:unnamed protein product [Diamesa hyperborea]